MKAVILAGGRGSRITELTQDGNKSMLEINGKPLIEYNLDHAVEFGVSEIVLVVGHRAEDIINNYGNSYKGISIKYAIQREQKGLVHAVETAAPLIGQDDFLLMLADEILPSPKLKEMLAEFNKKDTFICCGVVREEDRKKISKTYTLLYGDGNRIFRLIEKPENALNDLQGTGHCIFRNKALSYIPLTPVNVKRDQKELVDWIQVAVDLGKIVKYHEIDRKYTNVNTKEDYDYALQILNSKN